MRNLRPTFKISVLLLATSLALALQVFAAQGHAREIALTWSDDPKTTQTVSWKCDASVTVSSIAYRPEGSAEPVAEKSAVLEKLPQAPGGDVAKSNFFCIKLAGLKPGTAYAYAITAGGAAGEPHVFTTAPAASGEFTFLVFGDSQSGNPMKLEYKPWQETLHQAFARTPDAKFFVNVGDLVETGQSYAHWQYWFEAAQGVIDTIPAMPVTGNHETYSPGLLHHDPKPLYFLAQFKLPPNGPEKLLGQAYSYDYGCAHLVVLDSQQDEEGGKYGDVLSPQSEWLGKDLAATRQPWKIVFFHKPPYNNKQGRPNAAVKAAFCPVFDQYQVDVVFNGHEHGLYRTYPIKADQIQSGSNHGTVYCTTGRSGAKYYDDLGPTAWDVFAYNPKDQPCYETVQVSPTKLAITARKQDGTLIDEVVLNK